MFSLDCTGCYTTCTMQQIYTCDGLYTEKFCTVNMMEEQRRNIYKVVLDVWYKCQCKVICQWNSCESAQSSHAVLKWKWSNKLNKKGKWKHKTERLNLNNVLESDCDGAFCWSGVQAKTRSSSSWSSMLQIIWIGVPVVGETDPFWLEGMYDIEAREEMEALVDEQTDLVRGEERDSLLK